MPFSCLIFAGLEGVGVGQRVGSIIGHQKVS